MADDNYIDDQFDLVEVVDDDMSRDNPNDVIIFSDNADEDIVLRQNNLNDEVGMNSMDDLRVGSPHNVEVTDTRRTQKVISPESTRVDYDDMDYAERMDAVRKRGEDYSNYTQARIRQAQLDAEKSRAYDNGAEKETSVMRKTLPGMEGTYEPIYGESAQEFSSKPRAQGKGLTGVSKQAKKNIGDDMGQAARRLKNDDPIIEADSAEQVALKQNLRRQAMRHRHAFSRDVRSAHLFGSDVTRRDRMRKMNNLHDRYAENMVDACLGSMKQGANAETIMSAVGMASMLWCVCPRFRDHVGAHLPSLKAGINSLGNSVQRDLAGDGYWKNTILREKAQTRIADFTRGMKNYIGIITGNKIPRSYDSAALELVDVTDNAYESMREEGADTDLILNQYSEMVDDLHKEWKADGLDVDKVNSCARYIAGVRVKADPSYAARFDASAYGKFMPIADTQYSEKDDVRGMRSTYKYDGGWENINHSPIIDASGYFTPRPPMDKEDSRDYALMLGDNIKTDVAKYLQAHDYDGAKRCLVGYMSGFATYEKRDLIFDMGQDSDVARAASRVHVTLDAMQDDNTYTPEELSNTVNTAFASALGVLGKGSGDIPPLQNELAEFDKKFGKDWYQEELSAWSDNPVQYLRDYWPDEARAYDNRMFVKNGPSAEHMDNVARMAGSSPMNGQDVSSDTIAQTQKSQEQQEQHTEAHSDDQSLFSFSDEMKDVQEKARQQRAVDKSWSNVSDNVSTGVASSRSDGVIGGTNDNVVTIGGDDQVPVVRMQDTGNGNKTQSQSKDIAGDMAKFISSNQNEINDVATSIIAANNMTPTVSMPSRDTEPGFSMGGASVEINDGGSTMESQRERAERGQRLREEAEAREREAQMRDRQSMMTDGVSMGDSQGDNHKQSTRNYIVSQINAKETLEANLRNYEPGSDAYNETLDKLRETRAASGLESGVEDLVDDYEAGVQQVQKGHGDDLQFGG